SYREDVIANNLANAETVGFKKDLATFVERRTAAAERGLGTGSSDPMMEHMTGGLWTLPTGVDVSQGELEQTGHNLDVGVVGKGYFMAQDGKGQTTLTRDGRFAIDRSGNLIMAHSDGQRVLDRQRKPIVLDPRQQIAIDTDGTISADKTPVARLGVFDVPKPELIGKQGG